MLRWCLLGLVLAWSHAFAARHALVFGNDAYRSIAPLRNARADADAIAAALGSAGYAVTVAKDRDLRQMQADVRAFRARIQGGDEVVVVFSGHGVQIEGTNFLLPVDVGSDSAEQVRDEAVALSRLLDDIATQRPAFLLAIVDACRDNPFAQRGRAFAARGLARVSGATGQMVIFAAGEGQQALDRLGPQDSSPNGVFMRVFVREMMRSKDKPVHEVLRTVRDEVNRLAQSVRHEQVPAIYDQALGTYYFFSPGARVQSGPADEPAAQRLPETPSGPRASSPAPTLETMMAGVWDGTYRYRRADGGPGSTPFQLHLKVDGRRLSGTIVEPNTFGDRSTATLQATIDGVFEAGRIRFVKRYDGTGGVRHSVSYEGDVDLEARTMSGLWAIPPNTGGSFSAQLKR